MSQVVRKEFEAMHKVPSEARYVQQIDAYKYWQYPSVDHPAQDFYEAFKDGWKAAQRQESCDSQTTGGKAMKVTSEMVEQAAQRLVRWEGDCTWPNSWDALTVAAARQDAERALRSGLAVMPDPKGEAIDKAMADYGRGKCVHEIMRELKAVQREG